MNNNFLFFSIEDNLILRDLLTKQITHLNIDMKQTTEPSSLITAESLGLILTLCQKLIVLNYGCMFHTRESCTPVFLRSRDYLSSNLTKLKINVGTFLGCLTLLDGRLNSLSTLIINILAIDSQGFDVEQRVSINPMKKKNQSFQ